MARRSATDSWCIDVTRQACLAHIPARNPIACRRCCSTRIRCRSSGPIAASTSLRASSASAAPPPSSLFAGSFAAFAARGLRRMVDVKLRRSCSMARAACNHRGQLCAHPHTRHRKQTDGAERVNVIFAELERCGICCGVRHRARLIDVLKECVRGTSRPFAPHPPSPAHCHETRRAPPALRPPAAATTEHNRSTHNL